MIFRVPNAGFRVLLVLVLLVSLVPACLRAQGAAVKPQDLVKQGLALEQEGKWQEALANYRSAAEQNPKYAEAFLRLGKLLLEHDSAAAAVPPLERARDLRHKDVFLVEHELGLAYYRTGSLASAIESYLKAVERKPKDVIARVELAEVYLANGNDEEAMMHDSIALSLMPNCPEAQMTLGRIYTRRRVFEPAKEAYRRILLANPDYAEAYEALGDLYKSTQPESAILLYREYLTRRPENATANFNVSGLYYKLSQQDRTALKRGAEGDSVSLVVRDNGGERVLVRLSPTFTEDSLARKRVIWLRDSVNFEPQATASESAFVYVGKAIQLGYDREDIYDFYVSVAVAARKRAAAAIAVRLTLEKKPNDARLWALLGQVLADSATLAGNRIDDVVMTDAIHCFKKTCEFDTNSLTRRRTYAWMASQYYKQKQYDSAITYNSKVLEIDPKAASAWMNIAYAKIYGKQDKAGGLAAVDKAIQLEPRRVDFRVFLMKTLYNDKEYDAAYRTARDILELAPDNDDAKAVKSNIDIMRTPKKNPDDEEE